MTIMVLNEKAKNNIVKYLTDNQFLFTIETNTDTWLIHITRE